jgi:predicted dehydrogenase
VCDIDLNRARAAQSLYGIPAAFDRLEAMLEEVRPDAVHVLLPPELHAHAAETCLSAGAHVYMEKPFCVTVEQCQRIDSLAQRLGLQIGVNHNLIFRPAFMDLLQAIRDCQFGAIEHVQMMFTAPMPGIENNTPRHWMFTSPERIMLELGPHPLSVCIRLVGRALRASTAVSGEVTLSNGAQFFNHWQTSLVCERGTAQCTFSVGGGIPTMAVHVIGEDAQAFVDLRRNTLQIIGKTQYMRMDDTVNGWKNSAALRRETLGNLKKYLLGAVGVNPRYDLQQSSFVENIADFYRALAAGRRPRLDAAEGTAVVEACQMIIHGAISFTEQKEERVAAV